MKEIFKIKPYWWVPIILFFILGIVSILPGSQESLLGNYHTLTPFSPLGLVIAWFLSWLSYKVGKFITQRGLK